MTVKAFFLKVRTVMRKKLEPESLNFGLKFERSNSNTLELALHTHVLVIQTQPKITVKLMSF